MVDSFNPTHNPQTRHVSIIVAWLLLYFSQKNASDIHVYIHVYMYIIEVTDGRLEQASQRNEMYCHNLEVMSSKSGRVELGVRGTSVLSCTWTKNR